MFVPLCFGITVHCEHVRLQAELNYSRNLFGPLTYGLPRS